MYENSFKNVLNCDFKELLKKETWKFTDVYLWNVSFVSENSLYKIPNLKWWNDFLNNRLSENALNYNFYATSRNTKPTSKILVTYSWW